VEPPFSILEASPQTPAKDPLSTPWPVWLVESRTEFSPETPLFGARLGHVGRAFGTDGKRLLARGGAMHPPCCPAKTSAPFWNSTANRGKPLINMDGEKIYRMRMVTIHFRPK